MAFFLFTLGLVVLVIGGEVLVRGAVALASRFGMSRLFIGLTIVSFGTSAPELLVSLKAAPTNPALAVGNVIGSNIANLALVMGLTAVISPLVVERVTLRWHWPVMTLISGLLWLLVLDGSLVAWEGGLLAVLLVAYIVWTARISKTPTTLGAGQPEGEMVLWKALLLVLGGCVGLAFGADWLVQGAIGIADSLGLDERQVGTVIVAFGTSVPELVTSLMAAIKKESDISVGNLIGSNLFNIALILGATSWVSEIPFSAQVMEVDMMWMLGVALLTGLAILPLKVYRLSGIVLFSVYIVYVFLVF